MDDAGLNPLELLRAHDVLDVREVHTYIGEIEGLGPVRIRVLDGGTSDHHQHRWTVEIYDEVDHRVALEQGDRLPLAIAASFQALRTHLG
jgi:hypothetical protein